MEYGEGPTEGDAGPEDGDQEGGGGGGGGGVGLEEEGGDPSSIRAFRPYVEGQEGGQEPLEGGREGEEEGVAVFWGGWLVLLPKRAAVAAVSMEGKLRCGLARHCEP